MEPNANSKVSCIVNYTYEASEPDELTIRPGDILRDVDRLKGGWWSGELQGRVGMFPDNFVSVLTSDHEISRPTGVQGRCRAVYSYQPANPDELPLAVGDLLDVIGEVEEGWWQGRSKGRVGVFPSNFVMKLDPPPASLDAAPALPPKPVKEQCRVLYPYTAVNDDELTLTEGDVVTIVSKDAPDKGWWKGELNGRVGLFPDNFVQMISTDLTDDKKPDRPPGKTSNIYPILNQYNEKTSSVKEITTTTSKISSLKENTHNKEISTQRSVTHTNKSDSEKTSHSETIRDGTPEPPKKPPLPLKKSPTPAASGGGLLSGLKNKMSNDKDKDKDKDKSPSNTLNSASNGTWDRTDGGIGSKPANDTNTLDLERNPLLFDRRQARAKAPRRRPPSQVLKDDAQISPGLINGHSDDETSPNVSEKTELTPDKNEDMTIKARTKEWAKHTLPWMDELKAKAKKATFTETKSQSVSSSSESTSIGNKSSGSTDRILEVGLDEKKSSSHILEMSKSTSSISTRMSAVENFEETRVRHSMETSKKDSINREPEIPAKPAILKSPTAAGRTSFTSMLDELKKPSPPSASVRTELDKSPNKLNLSSEKPRINSDKRQVTPEKPTDKSTDSVMSRTSVFEMTSTLEKTEDKGIGERKNSTLERRMHSMKSDGTDALITHLNNRVLNLEKLLEVQNTKFNAAIEELNTKLALEAEKRIALQAELEKFAHCVTQV